MTRQVSDTRRRRGLTNVKMDKECPKKSTLMPNQEAKPAFGNSVGANSDKAPINSSPEAFAAAWNVAAGTKAWKRDGKKGQNHKTQKELILTGNQQCHAHEKLQSSPSIVEEQKPCVEDLPMPKWFRPSADNIVTPLPVGLVRKPDDTAQLDRFVQAVGSALLQSLMTPDGQGVGPAEPRRVENQTDKNIRSQESMQPLKVHTPYMECTASGINPELPIKKRVPDWGF